MHSILSGIAPVSSANLARGSNLLYSEADRLGCWLDMCSYAFLIKLRAENSIGVAERKYQIAGDLLKRRGAVSGAPGWPISSRTSSVNTILIMESGGGRLSRLEKLRSKNKDGPEPGKDFPSPGAKSNQPSG